MSPMLNCAVTSPCSAAFSDQYRAFFLSTAVPLPLSYRTPQLNWARAWPCSAAFSNQYRALA